MKLFLSALLLALGVSQSAIAQTLPAWAPLSGPMGGGAAACTPSGPGGNIACFGMRCAASGGPEWHGVLVGGDSAEGQITATLVIDGRSHETLDMQQIPTEMGVWRFTAAYEPDRHGRLLERLQAGGRLYVIFGTPGSAAELSLAGATRELGRVLAQCDVRAAPPAAPAATTGEQTASLPETLRALPAEIEGMCNAMGGRGGFDASIISLADINADGITDYLIDLGRVQCGTGVSPFCGAAQCEFRVLISDGPRHVEGVFFGFGPSFAGDAVMAPCPGGGAAAIRLQGGEVQQGPCQ